MGKIDRRQRWLLGAGGLGAALVVTVLLLKQEQTSTASLAVTPPKPEATIPAQSSPPNVLATTSKVAKDAPAGVRQNYIIQASSAEEARRAVNRAGGIVTGDLEIIRAVGAELDSRELEALQTNPVPGLRVYDDAPVTASYTTSAPPETYYPTQVGASAMHTGGVTGRGVTVAVLDK